MPAEVYRNLESKYSRLGAGLKKLIEPLLPHRDHRPLAAVRVEEIGTQLLAEVDLRFAVVGMRLVLHDVEPEMIERAPHLVKAVLRLDEDLVEAISLAHDLGHTPFGHAGQDALNECMRDFGGFEHNLQSLRVVDLLEDSYASFRGLNLTYETREGILKHCSARNARELGELGLRFLKRTQPGLEAQLANVADEIAYNNHDVDDGLRSVLISLEELLSIPFFAEQLAWVRSRFPGIAGTRQSREVIRRMIDVLVGDLVATSSGNVAAAAPRDIDAVRAAPAPLIGFSAPFVAAQLTLKEFLRLHLYAHPHVRQMTAQAHETVRSLFAAFMADLDRLPPEHAAHARDESRSAGPAGAARVVADYVAGMTDRFALQTREALGKG